MRVLHCSISYCLDLKGPSLTIDTACSSGSYALHEAFKAIEAGECDSAVVCGSNLLLHPSNTISFFRLGIVSKDGRCRPFDENGTGYARAEAVSALFLQKACNAKRIYGSVVYSAVNNDG